MTRKDMIRNETNMRDNDSGAGFQKYHESLESNNWYGHVMRRVEDQIPRKVLRTVGYTREREERTTDNKMEGSMPTRL